MKHRQNNKLLIYGREVNDSHTIDYDVLSTWNISATEKLLKRIETLENRNGELVQL